MTSQLGVLSQIVGRWDVGSIAIFVVIAAAVIALVWIALRQFGIAVPGWVSSCLWICVIAMVVIFCIRFVMTL